MPKYQQSKIYTIRSYSTDKIYIGSTTQRLSKRIAEHRTKYKAWKADNSKKYTSSYEIVKYDDNYIELLENYECLTREGLLMREGQCIRDNDCVNKVIPGRTRKQHYQDNAEALKAQRKQYCMDNADKIKQYYQDNPDKVKAQKKQWRMDNPDKIKAKHACACGGRYTRCNKSAHMESKIHKEFEAVKALVDKEVLEYLQK